MNNINKIKKIQIKIYDNKKDKVQLKQIKTNQ